jgi:hypothetical protein
VQSIAEHQNVGTITVVGGKNECNSSSNIQSLVRELAKKLPTRRVHGNAMVKRQSDRNLKEVRDARSKVESTTRHVPVGSINACFCFSSFFIRPHAVVPEQLLLYRGYQNPPKKRRFLQILNQ